MSKKANVRYLDELSRKRLCAVKNIRYVNKVIIQIPCYNEAETLSVTLNELPRQLEYCNTVEWLIVDDGSTDNTSEVAKSHGVDHIIRHGTNQGLARTFETALEASIALGADIIINTDADNQYNAADIPKLLMPVLLGADMSIGTRPIDKIEHFSWHKKKLQRLGSKFIRAVSQTDVQDAPSGFRAISRSAALKLNVFSDYTYTLETIIQAGQKGMSIECVDIRVNEDNRPSRLVKSLFSYVKLSAVTASRIFITYRPLRSFTFVGGLLFFAGLVLGIRYLYYFASGAGDGHVQSLILTAILLLIGFQTIVAGIVADLVAVNRKLLENIDYRLKKTQYESVDSTQTNVKTPYANRE